MMYVVTVRDGRDGSRNGYLDTLYLVDAESSEDAILQTATFLKNLPHRYARSDVSRIEVRSAERLTDVAKSLSSKVTE